MKKTSFSFLLPCYNQEKLINKCLESIICVINSTDNISFKIICINDGSKDKTLSILNSYQKKYKYIKVVSQANIGVCLTRQKLIDMCDTDYFTFVDPDDLLIPRNFKKIFNINN
jgi:glycosyltransferase involved in cell wall biosynthesis